MRGMMELVGIMLVLIIGVAVVVPVITEVSKQGTQGNVSGNQTNISTMLEPYAMDGITNTILQTMPIFIAVAVILVIVGMFPFGDIFHRTSFDDEDAGDKEVEEADPVTPEELPEEKSDKTKERLWAEEILKRRYARGEISTQEYNERMANL
jgi:uncharacterized membrane protein